METRPRGPCVNPLIIAHLPTPIERATRLGEILGVSDLWIKRDDLTGLGLGGNKVRKLDLLVQDAVDQGCNVLVSGGGRQSNHARVTAAAARRFGIECHLAISGPKPKRYEGNLLICHLLGATIHFDSGNQYYEIEESILNISHQLAESGGLPYPIPVGGASAVGVGAYALAACEIEDQFLAIDNFAMDWIVLADGSGGTHAGLLLGLGASHTRVLGVDVGTRPDLDEAVPDLVTSTAEFLSVANNMGKVFIDHDHIGPGYGRASEQTISALRTAAQSEGLILDPVYTAKALDALRTHAADGRINGRVVFLHTGGTPALFTQEYESQLIEEADTN